VIDFYENERTSRRYAAVFFVLIMKFMMTRHCLTINNASFIIFTNSREYLPENVCRQHLFCDIFILLRLFSCCPLIYSALFLLTASDSALGVLTPPSLKAYCVAGIMAYSSLNDWYNAITAMTRSRRLNHSHSQSGSCPRGALPAEMFRYHSVTRPTSDD